MKTSFFHTFVFFFHLTKGGRADWGLFWTVDGYKYEMMRGSSGVLFFSCLFYASLVGYSLAADKRLVYSIPVDSMLASGAGSGASS